MLVAESVDAAEVRVCIVVGVRDGGVGSLTDGAFLRGSDFDVRILLAELGSVRVEVSRGIVDDGMVAYNVWLISLVWVMGHALDEVGRLLVMILVVRIVRSVVLGAVIVVIEALRAVMSGVECTVVRRNDSVVGANKVVFVLLLTLVVVVAIRMVDCRHNSGVMSDKVVVILLLSLVGLIVVVAIRMMDCRHNSGVMRDKVVVIFLLSLVGLIVVVADGVHHSGGRHNSRVMSEVVVVFLFLSLVVVVVRVSMVDRSFPSSAMTDK